MIFYPNIKSFTIFSGGLFLFLFTPNLKAQVPGPGMYPHSQLNNPQIVIYRPEAQPELENWTVVISKIGQYSSASRWQIYSDLQDELGAIHYRVRHHYKGIPSLLSMGILHSKSGKISSINGDFVSESQFSGKRVINSDQAREKALRFLPAEVYYWQDSLQNEMLRRATGNQDTGYFPKGELMYCPPAFKLGDSHRLCYRFDVLALTPLLGKSIYVDAETGDIIASNDLILHTDVKGTAVTKYSGTQTIFTDSVSKTSFRLREITRGKGIETYNCKTGTSYSAAVDFTDSNNYWNNVNAAKDEVATDAHWGAEATYDYYNQLHSRNSFDNNGAKILSYVHYGVKYDNAFWNGSSMTYGDGNSFNPLSALDVCGHEITHAVTTNTAALVYSYESGALNESFSDIFGQTIEIWARPSRFNWLIGEDITPSKSGIRSMANPNTFRHPKFYKYGNDFGNYWHTASSDNGGVHINSGVQNHWYYLIANGLSGSNEKGWSYKIDSLGIIKAAKIAYRNLSVYLTSSSKFSDARTFSIMSASDLYGQCSNEVVQVTNAWWVCGVGNKYDSSFVKANFLGDTMACKTAKNLQFFNYSDNFKSSSWDFGDGQKSAVTNPLHAYSSYGKFTVKLVVESCFKGKKDSITRVKYVNIDSTYDICKAFLLPKSGSDSAVGCKGFVYDDGGEGQYGGNKIVSFKLSLPGADSIRFRYKVFDYEAGFDSLVMYVNAELGANRIGQYSGTSLPFEGLWNTIEGNALIFKQYSDAALEGKGFKLEYEGLFKPLSVTLNTDTTICYGNVVKLQATASGGRQYQYAYSWIGSGTAGGGSSQLVKPLSTQQYSVVLWDGCLSKTATASQVVYVLPKLGVKITSNDTAVCIGQTMYLSAMASGGDTAKYSYTWSAGLGNQKTAFIVLTDTLPITLTLSDGCSVESAIDTSILFTYSALKLVVSNDTILCFGNSSVLTANVSGGNRLHGGGSYTYDWSNGIQAGSISIKPAKSTMYYVVAKDDCSPNATDSILVTLRSPLFLSAVNDTVLCDGQSLQVNLVDSGGNSASRKVIWENTGINGNNPVLNPLGIGKTAYRVWVRDGCTPTNDTTEFTIDRRAPLRGSISLSDSILCYGDTTLIRMSASGGRASTLSWTLDAIPTNVFLKQDAPIASHTYRLLVSDACSLPFADSVAVIVAPAKIGLSLTAFDSTVCLGSKNGYLSVAAKGGFSPYTFQWNDPLQQKTAKATGLGKGKYTLRVFDSQGCRDSINLYINEFLINIKPLADTTIFRGGQARLYAFGLQRLKWMPKETFQTADSLKIVLARPTKRSQYTLFASDVNGCLWLDTVWVNVVDPELLRIPNLISPNGDGHNDFWDLFELAEYEKHSLEIYNRAGILVYSTLAYQNDWSGKDNAGNELPEGIYFYLLKHNTTLEQLRGFIQIFR